MRVENISKHGLDLMLPVSLIIVAQVLIFLGSMKAAMIIHALNMILLVLLAAYIENRVYPVLMLLSLFRLLDLAMPTFFDLTLYSYPIVYAPMLLPIYLILKERMFSWSEVGITAKGFWFFMPLALAVGFFLGWGEYQVLRPGVLIPDFSLMSVLALSLTMILFVGLVEEFVFRSALQTVMEERLGSIFGLVVASVLFGVMHSGYHIPLEVLYVSLAGMVFGLLFRLTKSLPIISLVHGVTNVSLFLV
ncbi:MAG TPA: type II CAAX endopeptidase family protein, partial [Methanotrichaceae archaeon]|nr:type II CAAX endopeptidase family protein [Methanotrichaceae archaeon]